MPGNLHGFEFSARSASISTSVMGLPFAGHVGVPLMSSLLVRISGKSLPSFPSCVNVLFTAVGWIEPGLCSCLDGVLVRAGFVSEDTTRSWEVACCRVVRLGALERVRGGQQGDSWNATYVDSDFAPSGLSRVNCTSYVVCINTHFCKHA